MTAPFLLTKSPKSVGIAILLTFVFGPIGLFYASISGGLLMTLTPIILLLLLYSGILQGNYILVGWTSNLIIVFLLTYWLITIIWAVLSVNSYNREIEEDATRQFELQERLREADKKQALINANQKSPDINTSAQGTTVSTKPSLEEWAKNNPDKSFNDYYSKFGR